MKGTIIGIGALGAVIACALASVAAQQSARTPSTPIADGHHATLQQYCVTCHNARLKTGGLAIDQLDIANLARDTEAWEKVVRMLRVGAMPPRGVRDRKSTRLNSSHVTTSRMPSSA